VTPTVAKDVEVASLMRWSRARRGEERSTYRQLSLFAGCGTKELRKVEQIGTRLQVPAGRRLTRAGDQGREVVVVLAGVASCEIDSKVVATFAEGDFFGEVAVLDGGPRTATVVARTDMDLLILDRFEFETLVKASPEVAHRLLQAMARRLRSASATAA
jgi:CRP/FNR family transcriptional regulator, cyclic AMP receptor protein